MIEQVDVRIVLEVVSSGSSQYSSWLVRTVLVVVLPSAVLLPPSLSPTGPS